MKTCTTVREVKKQLIKAPTGLRECEISPKIFDQLDQELCKKGLAKWINGKNGDILVPTEQLLHSGLWRWLVRIFKK
jgi:hypothetical protein